MTPNNEIISTLLEMGKKIEPVSRARVVSCIVHKRNIVAYGICRNKTHPLQKKYCRHPEGIFLHAEIDAIRTSIKNMNRDVDFLRKSVLYVARIKQDNEREWIAGMACPCSACQQAIDEFKIPHVVYTTGDDKIVVI